MAHKGFCERIIIEVGRSDGRQYGITDYRALQRELTPLKGMSLAEIERTHDETPQVWGQKFIGRGRAANTFREKGQPLDRLAPLKRYLRSNVGRPWNHVVSELRTASTGRSDSVRHVLSHVRDYVEERPVFVDGHPCHRCDNWSSGTPLSPGRFFVDQYGILQEVHASCGYRLASQRTFEEYTIGKDTYVHSPGAWSPRYEQDLPEGWYRKVRVLVRRYAKVLKLSENKPVFEYGRPGLELRSTNEVQYRLVPLQPRDVKKLRDAGFCC